MKIEIDIRDAVVGQNQSAFFVMTELKSDPAWLIQYADRVTVTGPFGRETFEKETT